MISQERSLAPTESATGQEQPHRAPGKRTLTMAIQRRATAVAPETGRQAAAAPPSVDPVDDPFGLHLLGGGGVPLPGHIRERFEASLGVDLGGVRLNTGPDSSAAATGLSARAFALGQDIHFGAGELDLTSAAGLELLAHEVAHTVQQGRGSHGPQEKLEVSEPGDACELEADRAAAAMLAGEPTQVTNYSGAARKVMRDVTADARATIVGHASPRWDAPRGATPAQRNQELSRQRAQEVERFFREIMTRELRRRAVAAHITAAASGVLDEDRQNVPPASVSEGRGSQEGLRDTHDQHSNQERHRRVDLDLTVTYHHSGQAPVTVPGTETVTIPGHCDPPRVTRNWSVSVGISASGGLGGEANFATVRVTNRDTGEHADFAYVGAGFGAGLSLPGVGVGSPTPFQTSRAVGLADFTNILVRMTSAGVNAGPIGYGLQYISFPTLGANSIDVGGFSMGGAGISAGTSIGTMRATGPLPGPHCTPPRTETRPTAHTEMRPWAFDQPQQYHFTATFPTGSATLTEAGLQDLEHFVAHIMAEYDRGGMAAPPGAENRSR